MAQPHPPFRADHIGSLLRPEELLAARRREGDDRLDREHLHALEDENIEKTIRLQEEIGLKSITDGEFRCESWRLGFVHRVEGFSLADSVGEVDLQQDDSGERRAIGAAPLAVARARKSGSARKSEEVRVRDQLPGAVDSFLRENRL